jgi:CheY-like chemotaxis protein
MSDLRTNVLVVEDDATLRTLLSAVLSRSGYVVRSSHDGFSALKKIRSEMPDIVLSDLFMPGMSGFEFLSVVRRRYPSLRAVAMSSAYSGKTVPTGIAADAFYEKASNVLSLLEIVARIDEYRAMRNSPPPCLLSGSQRYRRASTAAAWFCPAQNACGHSQRHSISM